MIRFRIFTYHIYNFSLQSREWCRVCVCAERTDGRLHLLLVRTRWNCSRETSVWAVCDFGDGDDCCSAVVVNGVADDWASLLCESHSVFGKNSSRRSFNFFRLAITVSHSVVSYILLAHCGIKSVYTN